MALESIKAKKWDGDGVPLADSNVAEIGTAEDKAARKAAAATEKAWQGIGQTPGVKVFRIENFQVVPFPETSHGDFYTGDSYIVLHTQKEDSGKLSHGIYFWLGEYTTTDEMGTAAYKTVELDDFLDGEPTQHREVQGHESTQFKALFPDLTYLEGGVDSGFHHVAEGAYQAKLLRVRKTNAGTVRIMEVTLGRESLNQGDCFILDMGLKLYVWCGDESSPFEKDFANKAAENIENERDGRAKSTRDIDDAFWEQIGGAGEIAPASSATDRTPDVDHGEGVLFKLSDTTGSLVTSEVARGNIGAALLDSKEVMMLDTGAEIFLWVGSEASPSEGRNSMATAMAYLKLNNKKTQTPIHMFKEGSEIKNEVWKKIMASGPAAVASKASVAPPSAGAAEEPSTQRLHTTSPAPTAESDSAAGVMSLGDLQDAKIWKPLGVDAHTREMHLADDEFQKLFSTSKGEFQGMPQWKKDQAKKKHGLF